VPPEPTPSFPRVWALLGARVGDNNQVLALAEALDIPFETKPLAFNRLYRMSVRLLGPSMRSLTPASRGILAGDPPDLTISVGRRSVPAVLSLRARSGGRMRTVHIGNPRISPDHFDLVITTPQYPVPDRPNVLRLPVAMGRTAPDAPASPQVADLLARFPGPRRLLLIGGPTRFWWLAGEDVAAAVATLLRETEVEGGSLLLLGSQRTPAEVMRAAEAALSHVRVPAAIVPREGPPSYPEMLAAADRIYVTADSVSMISEALGTGKPLGLVPIRQTGFGRFWMASMGALQPDRPSFPRDLRFFWRTLEERGLAGTVAAPSVGTVPDVVAMALERIRPLLAPPAPPATGDRGGARSAPVNPA